MSGAEGFSATLVPHGGGAALPLRPVSADDCAILCPADEGAAAFATRARARKTVDDFMAGLASRGPLSITDDVGVRCEVGDAPGAMKVTLYGKTAWGDAYLTEVLSRKGRDCLPFPVPEVIPSDMDPQLVAAMPELHAYYDDHMTWGSLHIVLDDGNVSDEDVDLCLGWAKERGDHAGANIARLLQAVSLAQRVMLHEWWYGRGPFEGAR